MSKVWRIARHHFIQESSKRSFLLVLFSLPIFIVLAMGLGFLFARLTEPAQVVGYVDQAQLLGQTEFAPEDSNISLIRFSTTEEAQSAIESEQIDAYFVLPSDYRDTHQGELFYLNDPPRGAQRQFSRFIVSNLLASQDPIEVERIIEGADITVSAIDTNREFASGGPGSGQLLPLVAAGIFAFSVLTISGYMLDVVVVEKENRTMEIIISSLSPGRMISGKIIGAIAIAALQIAVWVFFLVLAIWLGGNLLDNNWLLAIEPAWRDLILVILVAIPNYVLITAIMVAVGSTLVESQEAQQIGPFAFLILMLPIYLLIPIAANPNGPIAMLLTFFPLTSVVTLGMRSLIIEVPGWQFAVAALISAAGAVAAIWLATRVFRISLLRYGQRLKLRDLLRLSAAEKSAANVG
jgi:ABC-2 type transport system permease protein